MIKVNLLESVTDRPSGAARVEDKVSSPLIQTMLMALTVFGLLVVGAGYVVPAADREKVKPGAAADRALARPSAASFCSCGADPASSTRWT